MVLRNLNSKGLKPHKMFSKIAARQEFQFIIIIITIAIKADPRSSDRG